MASVSNQNGHRLQYYGRVSRSGSRSFESRRGAAQPSLGLVALIALAMALAACGERSFSAQEFIDEANDHGVKLVLGEPLSNEEGGAELYAITIEDPHAAAEAASGQLEVGHVHGGGSLRVEDDSEAAEAQYARCDQAGLFCYRAANIVLIFEADAEPDALAGLAKALRAIQAE